MLSSSSSSISSHCTWLAPLSVAAAVLFVAFLLLPWGNATFLLAVVVLFAWIAAVATRVRALP